MNDDIKVPVQEESKDSEICNCKQDLENHGLPEGILEAHIIKTKSFDEKVAWLKAVLTDETVNNLDVAVNIINFLRGGKKFTEEFFNCNIVIANNTKEFIDLKRQCKAELLEFSKKLVGIYLSCIKHCGNIVEADNPIEIPRGYFNALVGLDFVSLSRMQQDLAMKGIELVNDGNIYRESINILAFYSKALSFLEHIIDTEAVKQTEEGKELEKKLQAQNASNEAMKDGKQ